MAPYDASSVVTENVRERPQEIEAGRPSHTEQLARWITNVRHKKLKCNRSPKRDFRVEAVLTHALHQAEYELRAKQLSRLSRWLKLRKQLLKGVDYGTCGAYNMAEEEMEKVKDLGARQNTWRNGNLCEDLISLNNFLVQLKEVKVVAQR